MTPVIITQEARRDRVRRALGQDTPAPPASPAPLPVDGRDTDRFGLCRWCARRWLHTADCAVHELTRDSWIRGGP
jgi:hypothetical protein